jgi:hypothetical protein
MTGEIDVAIVRIAGRQQGNITHRQLRRLGVDDNDIRRRVRLGLLYRVHRGVYSVGRPPVTPPERASAAVLACGDYAALGHFGAAALCDAWEFWPSAIHVLAPTRRRHPGITTHKIVLPPTDIRHRLGIRVTSPARMLLDCVPSLGDDERKRLVNNARVRTRVTDEQIADIVERNPRHPGAKLLAWFIGEGVSESLEDLLFPWCDRYDVPRPETQVELHGFRVDAVYLAEKVVLELDGYDGHRGRESFESDRDRDATLAAYGYIVVRITTWRLERQPAREAARLLRILELRGAIAA